MTTTIPTAVVVGVGAEQGLGAALCRRFATGGHHVLVAGRTASKIEAVARGIVAAGGVAEAIQTDTTSEKDVANALRCSLCGCLSDGQALSEISDMAIATQTSSGWKERHI